MVRTERAGDAAGWDAHVQRRFADKPVYADRRGADGPWAQIKVSGMNGGSLSSFKKRGLL